MASTIARSELMRKKAPGTPAFRLDILPTRFRVQMPALARTLTGDYIQAICGRVIQSSGPLRYAIVDGMNVRDSRAHNYPPRWNAAPSQELLVIRRNHQTGEVSLDPLRWGLIPYWCKDPAGGRARHIASRCWPTGLRSAAARGCQWARRSAFPCFCTVICTAERALAVRRSPTRASTVAPLPLPAARRQRPGGFIRNHHGTSAAWRALQACESCRRVQRSPPRTETFAMKLLTAQRLLTG
jgi:SOS response associated peptidase (SRAP)